MSENKDILMDTKKVMEYLPHRYPFLMVDKVIEFIDKEHIIGHKNVTFNEPYFQGHFPGNPIMPGVMILEALAQMGAIYAKLATGGAKKDSLIVFSGVESLRFRRQVVPGDLLVLKMSEAKSRLGHWKIKGEATVDGEIAASGILLATEI